MFPMWDYCNLYPRGCWSTSQHFMGNEFLSEIRMIHSIIAFISPLINQLHAKELKKIIYIFPYFCGKQKQNILYD